MGKETVIHTYHHPLQYLQSQIKLQQSCHYRWIKFIQQFHLVINYKKGVTKKVADMLSRPSLNASVVLQNSSLKLEIYVEKYSTDVDFKDIYESLTHGTQVEEVNFHIHDRLLYHLGKLCIPQKESAHVIWEAHSSRIAGHFGVSKTMVQIQRYSYWPCMYETIVNYIKECVICSTSKPSN